MSDYIIFGIMYILSVLAAFKIGKDSTHEAWKDILVEDGLAEYYLDINNEKQWRMLNDKTPPEV